MADNPTLLTRRTSIRNAVALVGGTLTATQLGLLSDSFAAIAEDEIPRFLNREQFALLSRVEISTHSRRLPAMRDNGRK